MDHAESTDNLISNMAYHAYQEELAIAKKAGEDEAIAQARTRVRMEAITREVDEQMRRNPPNRKQRRKALSMIRKAVS